ncbi:G5 domain-containing protein [Agromyces sp. G08B096]|uniref:G5 domain-containing protein n=1 Tax=Agromyces sp. G08B096 TaxID=3156399 RepID=A0AAU7W8V5_9MICO
MREETIIEELVALPFSTSNVDDPNLDAGVTAVATTGVNGQKLTRIRVVTLDGSEISREVIEEVITVEPVNEVIAVGSRLPPPPPPPPAAGGCDPNYEGACVPVASDVDCAGGSGNGPAYVDGPVSIVGYDVYDLDRDGDGVACDV